MKLLVYVPLLTPRIKYIFNFIFNEILKVEVAFSVDIREFVRSEEPKFCYATQPIGGELFFKSSNLLLEHKITEQEITTTMFGEAPVPFAVEKSILPFDVFAASFYFLSRYEEYLSYFNPKGNLYAAQLSLQYKLGLIQSPVIDDWALILKNVLLKHFPQLKFGNKHFSFHAIQAITTTEQAPGRNFLSGTIDYFKSLIGKKAANSEENLAMIKNIINGIRDATELQGEQFTTASATDADVYIETDLKIPKSYVKLLKNNIGNTYSMYYDDYCGFRAGTCTPFYWYDLQIEKTSQLLINPVVATDKVLVAMKNPIELQQQINALLTNVRLVNGNFNYLSLRNDI